MVDYLIEIEAQIYFRSGTTKTNFRQILRTFTEARTACERNEPFLQMCLLHCSLFFFAIITPRITNISVDSAFRSRGSPSVERIQSNEKKDLLAKLENKTGVESELILAQEFKLPPQTQFRQKIQQDESVRTELTFSKEQMEIVERARALH